MEVNFCPECDNLLYIYTDENNEIYHGCKSCKYSSLKSELNTSNSLKETNSPTPRKKSKFLVFCAQYQNSDMMLTPKNCLNFSGLRGV